MVKPPTRQVPSDDCLVEVDGKEYNPHEGEWIKIIASFAVGHLKVIRHVAELQSQMDSLDDDDEIKKVVLTDDVLSELTEVLQGRIVAWNWTDNLNNPLPQPFGNPAAFRLLCLEEMMYLGNVIKGESPAEQGNGSAPSPTTSSATPRRRSRVPSSGGRSRSKASSP